MDNLNKSFWQRNSILGYLTMFKERLLDNPYLTEEQIAKLQEWCRLSDEIATDMRIYRRCPITGETVEIGTGVTSRKQRRKIRSAKR